MEKIITVEELKEFKKTYNKSKTNKVVSDSVQKNGVLASSFNLAEATKLTNIFNYEVKDMVSVTNQKQSGRCWMFASINVIRPIIAKNLGLKDIDLSFTYLFFFDKLEKANNKLEKVIANVSKDKESREFQAAIEFGSEADGGWWHMFKDLIQKYGICPMNAQPEAYSSTSSNEMDSLLNVLITKYVSKIKNSYDEGKNETYLREIKKECLSEVYKVLSICLGTPIEKFTFEYRKEEKDSKKEAEFVRIETTPLEFYKKYLEKDLEDFVSITNYPSKDFPYYEKFMNEGGVASFNQKYFKLNLPIEELKDAAIASIKDNMPCWFGSDVSASSFRKDGILSTEAYDVANIFDLDLSFDKFDRLRYHASSCNHAMTLTGVNIVRNKPNRWKVQNSWGTENGKQGIYVMSDNWFNEYVYEIVVDKKYLSQKAKEAVDGKVRVLKSWDPIA